MRTRAPTLYRVLAVVLLSISLLATATPLQTTTGGCREARAYLPAVTESGRGETVEVYIYTVPGDGRVYIAGVGSVGRDTLVSLVVAYILSDRVSGHALPSYDIYIVFPPDTRSVRGPSAGLMFTLVFASIGLGRELYINTSGTGAVNLDGGVETVGSVREKIGAVSSLREVRVFLVPVSVYLSEPLREKAPRDLSISPVADIYQVVGGRVPETGAVYQEGLPRGLLDNITVLERLYEERLYRELRDSLGVSERLNISIDRDTETLIELYKSLPRDPGYFFVRANILYTSLVEVYERLLPYMLYLDKSLYNKTYREFIERIEAIRSTLRRDLSMARDQERLFSREILPVYLVYMSRVYDLARLYVSNRGFVGSYNVSELVMAYTRALSLEFWRGVLDTYLSYYREVYKTSIGDIDKRVERLMKSLNISREDVSQYYSVLREFLQPPERGYLETTASVLYLRDVFYSYSYSLRYATVSSTAYSEALLRDLFYKYGYIDAVKRGLGEFSTDPVLGDMARASLYFIEKSSESYRDVLARLGIGIDSEILSTGLLVSYLVNNRVSVPLATVSLSIELPPACSPGVYTAWGGLTSAPGSTELLERVIAHLRTLVAVTALVVSLVLVLYWSSRRLSRSLSS